MVRAFSFLFFPRTLNDQSGVTNKTKKAPNEHGTHWLFSFLLPDHVPNQQDLEFLVKKNIEGIQVKKKSCKFFKIKKSLN